MRNEKIYFIKNNKNVYLESFVSTLLKGHCKKPVVIICPGGGYKYVSDAEGEGVALSLNTKGYNAFVLNYSTFETDDENVSYPNQVMQLASAILYIKQNAEQLGVDAELITLMGFSAGGHIVACYNSVYITKLTDTITKDKNLLKPVANILGYPLVDWNLQSTEIERVKREHNINIFYDTRKGKNFYELMSNGNEDKIKMMSVLEQSVENFSPTFVFHTFEDKLITVSNSIKLVDKLYEANVTCEFHLFQKGPHAVSLGTSVTARDLEKINKNLSTWFELAIEWLEPFTKKQIFEKK